MGFGRGNCCWHWNYYDEWGKKKREKENGEEESTVLRLRMVIKGMEGERNDISSFSFFSFHYAIPRPELSK